VIPIVGTALTLADADTTTHPLSTELKTTSFSSTQTTFRSSSSTKGGNFLTILLSFFPYPSVGQFFRYKAKFTSVTVTVTVVRLLQLVRWHILYLLLLNLQTGVGRNVQLCCERCGRYMSDLLHMPPK